MKRKLILMSILMIVLFAVAAYAGPLDWMKDKIGWSGLWASVSIVLGGIGIFTGKSLMPWKKFGQEVQQAVTTYIKAGDPKSPGGTKRTPAEWENIGREGMEAIVAAAEAFGKMPKKTT